MEDSSPATTYLFPNFGAEEGPTLDPRPFAGSYVRWAQLWSTLFRDPVSIVGAQDADLSGALKNPSLVRTRSSDSLSLKFVGGANSPFPLEACVADDSISKPAHGVGVPWLAVPSAWDEIASRGLIPWGPTPDVVRIVHHKAFCREVSEEERLDPGPIAGIHRVFSVDELHDPIPFVRELESTIRQWPSWACEKWTLKPAWGSSGRGRVPGFGLNVDTPEIRGSLPRFRQRHGVILEPFYDRSLDLSAQFLVLPRGDIQLLGTLEQQVAVSGAYKGHRAYVTGAGVRSASRWDDELIETSRRVVDRAARLGFVGPCGVDAFVVRLGDREILRPAVEFNARFTLGTIAIGLIHRAATCIPLRDKERVSFSPTASDNRGVVPDGVPWPSARYPVLIFEH